MAYYLGRLSSYFPGDYRNKCCVVVKSMVDCGVTAVRQIQLSIFSSAAAPLAACLRQACPLARTEQLGGRRKGIPATTGAYSVTDSTIGRGHDGGVYRVVTLLPFVRQPLVLSETWNTSFAFFFYCPRRSTSRFVLLFLQLLI
jgi:hypothetical protein